MQVPVYNTAGRQVSALELSGAVFGVKPKPHVLHEAVVAQQANARVAIAHTKRRGEVSGGGKKPWKQKGTGRARHGSIRSPIWRGGGIVFGPRSERNFAKKINQKVKRAALLMALSDKAVAGTLTVVEALTGFTPKTKTIAVMLKALPLKRGKTLLALAKAEKTVGRAAVNLAAVTPISTGSLNVVDLLKHVNLVTTVEGIKEIERIYKPI